MDIPEHYIGREQALIKHQLLRRLLDQAKTRVEQLIEEAIQQ